MTRTLMPISMSTDAHYVTQSSVWSLQYGKPLTNRRIAQLQREGHYGTPYVALQAVEKKRTRRRTAIAELFAHF